MYTFIHRFAGRTGRQEIGNSSARPASPKAHMHFGDDGGGAAAGRRDDAAALLRRPLEPGFAFDGLDPPASS